MASEIEDYLDSDCVVAGVVGVDASPSCGVNVTLDLRAAMEGIAGLDPATISPHRVNAVIRACAVRGRGRFTELLRTELRRRRIDIAWMAHDLIAELNAAAP